MVDDLVLPYKLLCLAQEAIPSSALSPKVQEAIHHISLSMNLICSVGFADSPNVAREQAEHVLLDWES